jgi:predicted esterase
MRRFNRRSSGPSADTGRLQARPTQPTARTAAPIGLQTLGLADDRDGLIYVPSSYRPERPAPLALMLHGAGGKAQQGLALLQPVAEEAGLILLAPDSRQRTWDIIMRQYGPDIAFIDQALAQTFSRYTVDPARVAIGGFSDGASYALSVGITNGDLFNAIIAFSPGFLAPATQIGQPRVFISHGTQDTVLPIQACSQRIVPQLEQAGYNVRYHEFEGPHTVPAEMVSAALSWFNTQSDGAESGNLR